MDEVVDPQQLCELARHIEKRDESEIVIRLGEKCQRNIKEVEDLRLARAPLTRELLALEGEQQKLVRYFSNIYIIIIILLINQLLT
jgi:hypothetical protein